MLQVERARRSIRVFFLIRELSLTLNMEIETQLPLTNPISCVQVNNVLDLSKQNIISYHNNTYIFLIMEKLDEFERIYFANTTGNVMNVYYNIY